MAIAFCPAVGSLLIAQIILFQSAFASVFPLEGESSTTGSSEYLRNREQASAGKTISIQAGQRIKLPFCLRRRSFVSIYNVLYSNDGLSDLVILWLDNTEMGSFTSKQHSNYGQEWKKMLSTGALGNPFPLPSGKHELVLKVISSDRFGIEIDKVDLFVSDRDLTPLDFSCEIQCPNDAPNFGENSHRDDVPPARFEQKSRSTTCAEEDNVLIPIYHSVATSYRLTATTPSYKSITRLNRRETDFTNCKILDSTLWQIGEADGKADEFKNHSSSDVNRPFFAGSQCHDFPGVVNLGSAQEIPIDVRFGVSGRSKGTVRSEVGSVFVVNLTDVHHDVDIGVQYKGRISTFSDVVYKRFTAHSSLHEWPVPDFTWLDSDENYIRLLVRAVPKSMRKHLGDRMYHHNTVKFDFLKLDKRRENGEKVFTIYSSKDIVVEGIDVDFWWLSPQSMTLRRTDTGKIWTNVDFFRVYVRLPYSDSMTQIFVLYQDGNARLLPLPPGHLDWIPFGSSVIIGQSDPADYRPHADIEFVDLDPVNLIMKLSYYDNGTVNLRLRNEIYKTVLQVSGAQYSRDLKVFPFATFRSMWVDDGNSDVEKLTSNSDQRTGRHILGNWRPFYATSVLFHRDCVSRHNTLSPDIRIDIFPENF